MSRRTAKRTQLNTAGPSPRESRERSEPRAWAWAAGVVGMVLVCFLLVPFSPRYGYFGDHDDFSRWGVQAVREGVLTLYDHAPPRVDAWYFINGEPIKRQRPVDRVCNYPPISAYIFWLNGFVHRAVDFSQTINTWWARAVFMTWGMIAHVIMALGVAAIVRRWRGGRAPFVAFLVTLFTPPIIYDVAFWAQTDAWLLAPAVWMLWALMERRWMLAGVCFGIMLGLKPQAVLFTPLWFVAAYGHRAWRGPLVGVGTSVGVVLLAALPFTLHSRFAWFEGSYYDNLVHAYPDTTLRAYNVWYIDLLQSEDRNSTRLLAGMQKDTWGKIFIFAGLAAIALAVGLRRKRSADVMLLAWTTVSMIAFVMLPTRVHERYIVLIFPFLVCCATLRPVLWPGVAILAVLSIVQMTHQQWLGPNPPERWGYFVQDQAEPAYQQIVKEFEAQGNPNIPSFETFLRVNHEQHAATRRERGLPFIEWALVITALVTSLYLALLILVRPISPPDASRSGASP